MQARLLGAVVIDYYPVEEEPIVIPYDADKINALLGTDIDEATMVKYFELS